MKEFKTQNQHQDLDKDPPLELTANVNSIVEITGNVNSMAISGFALKHDSGTVREWGANVTTDDGWTVIGGPVIGFHYKGFDENWDGTDLSLIVGDICRPKYFGAQ